MLELGTIKRSNDLNDCRKIDFVIKVDEKV